MTYNDYILLKQYLERGWTCPDAVKSQANRFGWICRNGNRFVATVKGMRAFNRIERNRQVVH